MALRFIDAVGVTYGTAWFRKWTTGANLIYNSSGGRRNAPCYTLFSGAIKRTLTHGTHFVAGGAWKWQLNNAGSLMGFWNDETMICQIFVNSDYTVSVEFGPNPGTLGGAVFIGPSDRAIAAPAEWHYYELDVKVSNAGGKFVGTATVRLDDSVILSGTANTNLLATSMIDGACTFNQVGWSTVGTGTFMDYYALDGAVTDMNGNASTCTAFMGDIEIDALMPAVDVTTNMTRFGGDGTHAYSCVNETPADDDTSYVFTSNTGSNEVFNHQPIIGFTGTLLGAQYSVLAKKDSEGLRTFVETVGTATVSTLEYLGTQNFLANDYVYYVAPLDSDNGVAWTTTNYNAEQFGFKLIT